MPETTIYGEFGELRIESEYFDWPNPDNPTFACVLPGPPSYWLNGERITEEDAKAILSV